MVTILSLLFVVWSTLKSKRFPQYVVSRHYLVSVNTNHLTDKPGICYLIFGARDLDAPFHASWKFMLLPIPQMIVNTTPSESKTCTCAQKIVRKLTSTFEVGMAQA